MKNIISKYDLTIIEKDGKERVAVRYGKPTPEDIAYIKSNKPAIIAELKKIEEEKIKAKNPKVQGLTLSYYNGDWYRANAVFCESGELPNWGHYENIFSSEALNKATANFWFEGKNIGYVSDEKLTKKLEELFNIDLNTTKEEVQKRYADLKVETQNYDDMRGKGAYISSIIFPNFKIFEKYVQKAFAKTLEKIAEKESEIKKIMDKAKETGEPQILSSYMTDCNDPNEECSTDSVTMYANPDGTTTKTRRHTW